MNWTATNEQIQSRVIGVAAQLDRRILLLLLSLQVPLNPFEKWATSRDSQFIIGSCCVGLVPANMTKDGHSSFIFVNSENEAELFVSGLACPGLNRGEEISSPLAGLIYSGNVVCYVTGKCPPMHLYINLPSITSIEKGFYHATFPSRPASFHIVRYLTCFVSFIYLFCDVLADVDEPRCERIGYEYPAAQARRRRRSNQTRDSQPQEMAAK